MKDTICCPPKVDTFLATTPVKPICPEKPRKTVKQLRAMIKEIEDVLDKPMSHDFFDTIESETKVIESDKIKSFSFES